MCEFEKWWVTRDPNDLEPEAYSAIARAAWDAAVNKAYDIVDGIERESVDGTRELRDAASRISDLLSLPPEDAAGSRVPG